MLIPMYFIIGVWGGPRKIYAAIKFFLFTFAGSVLMLVAIIATVYYVKGQTGQLTFNIQELTRQVYPYHLQFWAFLAFFVAFAIKVPMWPLHTWLPDAHVEAPDGGFRDPGRRAAEDGRVRHAALQPADVPRRRRDVRALGDRSERHRHPLRRPGLDDAEGPQEAGGLLEREPHGVRDGGHLRRHRAGGQQRRHGGGHPGHVQPRHPHGRPVPHGRLPLRTHAHARDRGHEPARQAAAGAGRLLPLLHPGVARAAGPERVRGRVPQPAGPVQLLARHGGHRRHRRDPGRRLSAVDVPARAVQRPRRRRRHAGLPPARLLAARDRFGGAARRVRRLGRRLSPSSS